MKKVKCLLLYLQLIEGRREVLSLCIINIHYMVVFLSQNQVIT